MKPRVKVCGITREEDAVLAAELGASAIGFVFWPRSPRHIAPDRAREIANALPAAVITVGVFVDQDLAFIRETASLVGLGAIQLHGSEPVELAAAFMQPVIKAVPVRPGFVPSDIDAIPRSITVLLDAHDPDRRGGTGRTIDWTAAREAAALRPIVLAGGLSPQNVSEAVIAVRPYAVDVSSGVESAPGIKDPDKMRAFFRAVAST